MVSIRVSQEGDGEIDGDEGHRDGGDEGYRAAKKATLLYIGWTLSRWEA